MQKYSSLVEIQLDLHSGKITCKDLVLYYLDNIKNNSHLNVFLEVYEKESILKAEELDKKIADKKGGRLAGMVIGIKDVLCHKDHKLQSSSKILDGFVSKFTGTAIQRLIDEDAIIIGRQNCDEFAMGSSNENSAFGSVLNNIDNSRVPGGSSGASAVAVQANLCLASIGSDTGGSVRQPAAFCGVIGLKPTYSRISRWGLVAYASSFDCIGTLTNSISDAALLLEIMSGSDDYDSTVSNREVPNYTNLLSINTKYKIAYPKELVHSKGINEEIRLKTLQSIEQLRKEGHTLEEVEFPMLEAYLPTYYILTTAEASTNLSRYDGVRFGYRSNNTSDLVSMYKKSRSEGFGKEVKKRIMLGTFVLSANYYDAYFSKAQKVRRLIQDKTSELLNNYDFLILPTSPIPPFKLGQFSKDALAMYLADVFTVQANLCGVPAISLPNGKDSLGLPIGIQLITRHFNETELLSFSDYFLSINKTTSL